MDHRELYKTKITSRGGHEKRRQLLQNKRGQERDMLRNFGRNITMSRDNSPGLTFQINNENYQQTFKKTIRNMKKNLDNPNSAIHYRPPFVAVVPVGKYVEAPATTALSKRIVKTQENIQKILTAKKVFPAKTPEGVRRSKRNVKRLNLNNDGAVEKKENTAPKPAITLKTYMRNNKVDNRFTFIHSTAAKTKNRRRSKKSTKVNFQVSDDDGLDGISPIEENDINDLATIPILSAPQIPTPTSLTTEISDGAQLELGSRSNITPSKTDIDDEEQLGTGPSSKITTTPNNEINTSLNYLSPFVTTTRGKGNLKRETINRNSVYKLNTSDEAAEDSEEVKKNKEAALYFEMCLNNEILRLNEFANQWVIYKTDNIELIDDHIDMIDVTIGQTKLLISNKFEQFRKLINECRFQNGNQPIYPLDLEGFWAMLKLQIDNVDDRFAKLEKFKNNDWLDPDEIMAKPKNAKKKGGRKGKNKVVTMSPRSGLKNLIQKFRQQKIEQNVEAATASSEIGSASARKRRNSLRVSVLSATIKNTPHKNVLNSSPAKISPPLDEIKTEKVSSTKKRSKIRFVLPRKSIESDVILVDSSPEENKENQIVENGLIEPSTPTNRKSTSRRYRNTPKTSVVLNLEETPSSATKMERRRSTRTPRSKLSFCDEQNNCSIMGTPNNSARQKRRGRSLMMNE